MKLFDLNAALKGKPVKTRKGIKVIKIQWIKTHKQDPYPLLVELEKNDYTNIISCTERGFWLEDEKETDFDLIMDEKEPEKRKIWVHIFYNKEINHYISRIFTSQQQLYPLLIESQNRTYEFKAKQEIEITEEDWTSHRKNQLP